MEELFYSSVHTGVSAWFGIAGIAGTAALILFFCCLVNVEDSF